MKFNLFAALWLYWFLALHRVCCRRPGRGPQHNHPAVHRGGRAVCVCSWAPCSGSCLCQARASQCSGNLQLRRHRGMWHVGDASLEHDQFLHVSYRDVQTCEHVVLCRLDKSCSKSGTIGCCYKNSTTCCSRISTS